MTAYRVAVVQTIRNDAGNPVDHSFVEYVTTLKQASYIVNRFDGLTEDDDRHVFSITIETIHIQT